MKDETQRKTLRNMIVTCCARFLLAALVWMSCCATVWADRTVSDGYGVENVNDSGTLRDGAHGAGGSGVYGTMRYFSAGSIDETVVISGRLKGLVDKTFTGSDTDDAYEFIAKTSEITFQSTHWDSQPSSDYFNPWVVFFDGDFAYGKQPNDIAAHLLTDSAVVKMSNLKIGHKYRMYIYVPNSLSGYTFGYEITLKPIGSTASKVTVSFNANGGSVTPSSQQYTVGSAYGSLPTPTRSGYRFTGWTTSLGGSVTASSLASASVTTLYAQWEKTGSDPGSQTVSVTFYLNDPSGLVSKSTAKTYTVGSTYGSFPSFTLSGYTFQGWYTSGGTRYYESSTVSASVTKLYAHWKKNEQEPTVKPDLQPYTPSGWSAPLVVSSSSSSKTGSSRFTLDDTIYVSWAAICRDRSAEAFKIALDVDGVRKQTWSCSGLNEGYYTHKDSYSIGKLSAGLHVIKVVIDSEEGVSESNESNNTYSKTITVIADEDDQHEIDISLSVSESGGMKSAKLATKSGVSYKFDCSGRPDWVTGLKIVDGSNSMTIGSGTTTYGGMNDGLSLSFTVAANTTSSSRSWTLYVYKGSEVFHRVTVRQDAGSTPTTYAVKFTPGAYGSGSRSPSTKTHGVSLTLPGAAFTRTGYTQTGWSTDYYGSTKDYSLSGSYTSNSDTTLYPYWTANTYSISYALNGGSHGSTHPTSATYDSAFYVSAPSRSGYTFAGWTVTSGLNTSTAKWGTSSSPSMSISSSSTKCVNGTGSVCFNNLTATSGGSVTLTANWTANPDPRLADFEINDGVLTKYKGAGGAVTVPAGVTSIGESAFYKCVGMTSVTVPSSVKRIEMGAFSGCSGLVSMTLPFVGAQRGGSGTFEDSFGYIFGNDRTSAEGMAVVSQKNAMNEWFYNISPVLDSVVITDDTEIGFGAFDNCSRLTSIELSSTVTNICGCAFEGCGGLTTIEIPSNVKSIGWMAFSGCTGLTAIEIPSSVTSIGSQAFSYCGGLEAFRVESSSTAFCSLNGLLCSKDGRSLIAGVNGDVIIPAGVISLADYAFEGLDGLTAIEIPSSVTSIAFAAFRGCSGLTSVKIPTSVTSISGDAFSGCSRLTSVTIPPGVTSIGDWAFYDCGNLTAVYVDRGDGDRVRGLYDWPIAVKFVEPVVLDFVANGGTGTAIPPIQMEPNKVYKLPKCTLTPPAGKSRFVGWACSNGRRYDDGMLVFDLAQPGETVTMTAIWE